MFIGSLSGHRGSKLNNSTVVVVVVVVCCYGSDTVHFMFILVRKKIFKYKLQGIVC